MSNYLLIIFTLICSVLVSEEFKFPPNNETLFDIKNHKNGIALEAWSANSKLQLGAPWPMKGRNQYHSAQSPFIGSATNTLKWKYQIGPGIDSPPAIGADGTIYIGSGDTYLYAINPTDGSRKWRYLTGGAIGSSPAIGADGTIYFGSQDTCLYALNPIDGSLKWSYQTGRNIYYSSPAIGADGTIYFGSEGHSTHQGYLSDGYLYAINATDGSLKWRYLAGDVNTGYGDISSSPAIGADGTIYVGSYDGYFHAINLDGSRKWRYRTGGGIGSSPAIGADGTIYFGSGDTYFYAINLDGSLKWRFGPTGGAIISSPAIAADGTIYFGARAHNNGYVLPSDYYLYGLDSVYGSGKFLFKPAAYYPSNLAGGEIISSPAIGADGTIYVGSYGGYFHAIYPAGHLKWRYETGGAIGRSSPAIGADGTIYIKSYDGHLYAFGTSTAQCAATGIISPDYSAVQLNDICIYPPTPAPSAIPSFEPSSLSPSSSPSSSTPSSSSPSSSAPSSKPSSSTPSSTPSSSSPSSSNPSAKPSSSTPTSTIPTSSSPSSSTPSSSSPTSSTPSSSRPSSSDPSSKPSSSTPSSSSPSSSSPTSQPSCGVGSYGKSALGFDTGCQRCPRGQYSSSHESPACQMCPMDTTTYATGSTSCTACEYPYGTNTVGSDGCPTVNLGVSVLVSLTIWLVLLFVFFGMLLYVCYFDPDLCFKVFVFGELIVPASAFDFISDISYIVSEQFYNRGLFWSMVASLLITFMIFPRVMIKKKLYPSLLKNIYKVFPGLIFSSEHPWFLTNDLNGIIAIKGQSFFKIKSREELEILDEIALKLMLSNQGMKNRECNSLSKSELIEKVITTYVHTRHRSDLINIETDNLRNSLIHDGYTDTLDIRKSKEEIVNIAVKFYSQRAWNPYNLNPNGSDKLYKFLMQIVVGIFLFGLQIFNIVLYIAWPFIMVLRLPIVLILAIFFSSTKLIFFRRAWDILIYLWTFEDDLHFIEDEKTADNEINLLLLQEVKLYESIFEISIQFILQLCNTSLNGNGGSSVYYASLAGSLLDLASTFYRYGYHFIWKRKPLEELEDASEDEIATIENLFDGFRRKKKSESRNLKGFSDFINRAAINLICKPFSYCFEKCVRCISCNASTLVSKEDYDIEISNQVKEKTEIIKNENLAIKLENEELKAKLEKERQVKIDELILKNDQFEISEQVKEKTKMIENENQAILKLENEELKAKLEEDQQEEKDELTMENDQLLSLSRI